MVISLLTGLNWSIRKK